MPANITTYTVGYNWGGERILYLVILLGAVFISHETLDLKRLIPRKKEKKTPLRACSLQAH